jgi:hypothetical protein
MSTTPLQHLYRSLLREIRLAVCRVRLFLVFTTPLYTVEGDQKLICSHAIPDLVGIWSLRMGFAR